MKIAKLFAATLVLAAAAVPSLAADKNYTRGSVWGTSLIKTEPGKSDDYIDSLKATYTTIYDEAIKEKVILSYKIFVTNAATPDDWDVMILTEFPNFAAIDTAEAKFDAIAAKLYGTLDKADESDKKDMAARAPIRKIFGTKLMQEIHYNK
jgi:hypothetical protein